MCHHYPAQKKREAEAQAHRTASPTAGWSEIRIDWTRHLENVEAYPLTTVAVLRTDNHDQWILENRQWGLVPRSWKPSAKVKTRKAFQRGKFNARCETMHTTWPWKLAWRQRCVMLARGFCEPLAEGGEGLYTLPEHPLFAIPGVWDTYESDDERIESCVMLTTQANALVASTRKPTGRGEFRQPVILTDEDAIRRYCSSEIAEHRQLMDLFRPWPDDQMACEAASTG